jgi:hypothetical protein
MTAVFSVEPALASWPGQRRSSACTRQTHNGGAAGRPAVAVMTAGEKIEQAVTKRPDSLVPARALLTLLGRHPADDDQPAVWNHVMHWSTGAFLGRPARSVVSDGCARTAGERLAQRDAPSLRPDRRECDRSWCATEVVAGSGAGD